MTASTSTARLREALPHEDRVLDALRARGWQGQLFGQALLTPQMRLALREADALSGMPTLLRWTADLLVSRGQVNLLVDVKTGRTDTPNYVIEDSAIEAARIESRLAPVVIVWPDDRVSRAVDVYTAAFKLWEPSDPTRTACRLIRKGDVISQGFNDYFGKELSA